jgi:ectoine hydroxylase-related dioxygenase (phytanoyl-CoA dioxygenase family)
LVVGTLARSLAGFYLCDDVEETRFLCWNFQITNTSHQRMIQITKMNRHKRIKSKLAIYHIYTMVLLTTSNDDNRDEDSEDSESDVLCEMLGISSLDVMTMVADESQFPPDATFLLDKAQRLKLRTSYEQDGYCTFPEVVSVSPDLLRRITDDIVSSNNTCDCSYEPIHYQRQDGTVVARRTLTRLENFVVHHKEWNELCNTYIRQLLFATFDQDYCLYKEKLNLKPPGGSGFAPHVDGPSLRVFDNSCCAPQSFITVMIAIDNMTPTNGCLRVCKKGSSWNDITACPVLAPDVRGSPDASGRAGAIPPELASAMTFTDVIVNSGTIVAFCDSMPHRSSPNKSLGPRRAVFLTYSFAANGDLHQAYYERMAALRREYKERIALERQRDELAELESLSTIPKV